MKTESKYLGVAITGEPGELLRVTQKDIALLVAEPLRRVVRELEEGRGRATTAMTAVKQSVMARSIHIAQTTGTSGRVGSNAT